MSRYSYHAQLTKPQPSARGLRFRDVGENTNTGIGDEGLA